MLPPAENYIAAFPPQRTAGNVTLRPLTLAGIIRLGAEGIDCGAAVPRDKALMAAFILSGETDWKRFLRRTKCGLNELLSAVETTLNEAFATFVKPMAAQAGPSPEVLSKLGAAKSGLGLPLEWAEWLCAEYGWSWQEALETPVATVYALAAAAHKRSGGKFAGMDYYQRETAREKKAWRTRRTK